MLLSPHVQDIKYLDQLVKTFDFYFLKPSMTQQLLQYVTGRSLSTEQYELHYFIFTDSDVLLQSPRLHVIYQRRLGWPLDTLMRFEVYLEISMNFHRWIL